MAKIRTDRSDGASSDFHLVVEVFLMYMISKVFSEAVCVSGSWGKCGSRPLHCLMWRSFNQELNAGSLVADLKL